MRRTTTALFAGFAILTVAASHVAAAPIQTGLQVLYEFDSINSPQVNSASGNAGTPGNLTVTNAQSRAGTGSADFGTGELAPNKAYMVVNTADVAALSPGAQGSFTTSFWWKPTTLTPSKQQSFWGAADDPNLPVAPATWPPFPALALSYTQNGNMNNLFRDANLAGAAESSDSISVAPNFFDGNWHHVAERIVVDMAGNAKSFARFIDGQPASVGSNTAASGWAMQNMILGQQYDDKPLGNSASQDLDGYLDDFAVWDRGLTNQEIRKVYNFGKQGVGVNALPETIESNITKDTTLYFHTGGGGWTDWNQSGWTSNDGHAVHAVVGFDGRTGGTLDRARPIMEASGIVTDLTNGGVTASSQIASATLHLFLVGADFSTVQGIDRTLNAYRLTRAWAEGGDSSPLYTPEEGAADGLHAVNGAVVPPDDSVSWTTPGGDFDPTLLGSFVVLSADGSHIELTVTITDAVKYWFDNPSQNFGILLDQILAGEDATRFFASSEDTVNGGAYRPYISVTLVPVPEPSSFVLALLGVAGVIRRKRR